MTVFLTATTDLQQSAAYEQALALVQERHGEVVTTDRGLFDSFREWRKAYKEVYGQAERIYVLARADGTVGLGIFKQCRFAAKQGIPLTLLFADGEGELANSSEHEEFGLERLGAKGEENLVRFATVRL